MAAALAFFSHHGHQVFHDPCPDLAAYHQTRGVVSSIIPVNCLPDHILSSGLELLEGLLAPSPTNSGTAFLAAYLASPPSATSVSNMPYGQRPAPWATISSLGGTSCVPGGSALRAPAPHDTAFTGSRFGGISSEQQASPSAAFSIWGGARVSLGGVPGPPLPPMTLLSRGLAARIQTGILLLGCSYPIRLDWRRCTLHSLMGGALAPHHLHPQATPLFRPFGIITGGLHSSPLLLLVIMGGLQSPPLFLLVIMVGLPSLPLPL